MSSSNRTASACDAVVVQRTRATGPLRLPTSEAADFIAEFNTRYAALGMSVEVAAPTSPSLPSLDEPNEKSPATSVDVTGDRLVR